MPSRQTRLSEHEAEQPPDIAGPHADVALTTSRRSTVDATSSFHSDVALPSDHDTEE